MISIATPSISALIAADTKTALDSSASASTSALGVMSLQFSTRLEDLQFIELHQENDGTYFLQGFKGNTPKKLKLPNNNNILKLHYSIRIYNLKTKVLRIEKRKQTLTTNPDPLANYIKINTGEIHFKNAQIVYITDSAATLIPNDSSYINHRVMNLLDLNEVGLPIDKLPVLTTDANEASARAQALTRIAKLKKENNAATAVVSTNASAAATAIPVPSISPLRWSELPNSTAAFSETVIIARPETMLKRTSAAAEASAVVAVTTAISAIKAQAFPATNPPTNTGMVPPPVVFNNAQTTQQLSAVLTVAQLANALERAGTIDVDESLSQLENPITIKDKDADEGWCGSCCM